MFGLKSAVHQVIIDTVNLFNRDSKMQTAGNGGQSVLLKLKEKFGDKYKIEEVLGTRVKMYIGDTILFIDPQQPNDEILIGIAHDENENFTSKRMTYDELISFILTL